MLELYLDQTNTVQMKKWPMMDLMDNIMTLDFGQRE